MNTDKLMDFVHLAADINPNEIADKISGDKLSSFCKSYQERVFALMASIMEDGYAGAEPVKVAHWELNAKHYFDNDNYGELVFYATVHCSNCGELVGEYELGSMERPDDLTDEDDWEIVPSDFYDEKIEIARGRIWTGNTFGKFCCHCGAKIDTCWGIK